MADNTNVHISDLPTDVDDAMLAEIFGHYGTVTWSKVMSNKGGKPSNAAIVEYASMDEARFVVENLNGNIPHGLSTPIMVSFKRQGKGSGKGGGFGKSGGGFGGYGKAGGGAQTVQTFVNASSPYGAAKSFGGGGGKEENTTLHISDLPAEVDDAMLAQIFNGYGSVTWCKVMANKGGKPSNAAMVEFASMDEARFVVENLNGNIPHGLSTPIIVNFKRQGGKGGKF